jgi:hypothetical protein
MKNPGNIGANNEINRKDNSYSFSGCICAVCSYLYGLFLQSGYEGDVSPGAAFHKAL